MGGRVGLWQTWTVKLKSSQNKRRNDWAGSSGRNFSELGNSALVDHQHRGSVIGHDATRVSTAGCGYSDVKLGDMYHRLGLPSQIHNQDFQRITILSFPRCQLSPVDQVPPPPITTLVLLIAKDAERESHYSEVSYSVLLMVRPNRLSLWAQVRPAYCWPCICHGLESMSESSRLPLSQTSSRGQLTMARLACMSCDGLVS